jgi:hypothetical protein
VEVEPLGLRYVAAGAARTDAFCILSYVEETLTVTTVEDGAFPVDAVLHVPGRPDQQAVTLGRE